MTLEFIEKPTQAERELWFNKIINPEIYDPDYDRERYLAGYDHIVDYTQNILFCALSGPTGGAQAHMHIKNSALIYENYYLQPRYCETTIQNDESISTYHFYNFRKWGDSLKIGPFNWDCHHASFIPSDLENKTELIYQILEECITAHVLLARNASPDSLFEFHWDNSKVDPAWPGDYLRSRSKG